MRRLKRRAEFLQVAAVRRSAGMPGLVLQAARQKTASTSDDAGTDADIGVGFTASKKVGGAVERNRAKRRLRALAREILPDAARPGQDYVLIARSETPRRPFALLRRDLISALKRLKSWTGSDGVEGR